jgi:hypothetical protein
VLHLKSHSCENLKFSTPIHNGNIDRHTGYLLRTEDLSSARLPTQGAHHSGEGISYVERFPVEYGSDLVS